MRDGGRGGGQFKEESYEVDQTEGWGKEEQSVGCTTCGRDVDNAEGQLRSLTGGMCNIGLLQSAVRLRVALLCVTAPTLSTWPKC